MHSSKGQHCNRQREWNFGCNLQEFTVRIQRKKLSFCSQMGRKYVNAIFHFPLQSNFYFKALLILKAEHLGLMGHKN